MGKLILVVFSVLGAVIALPIIVFLVLYVWAHVVENPRYARTYFADILEFESVAESRRWWRSGQHPSGIFGCTYAIVNISNTSAPTPPDGWHGQWIETPVTVPDGYRSSNILEECKYLWPDELNARLNRAHNYPGSYYSSGFETLLLYSPSEGIAAKLRFGD